MQKTQTKRVKKLLCDECGKPETEIIFSEDQAIKMCKECAGLQQYR